MFLSIQTVQMEFSISEDCLSYILITMAANDLVKLGARASASVV